MRLATWFFSFVLVLSLTWAGVAQEETETETDFLTPSGGQLGIGGKDGGFGLGTAVGDPTALYGPTRSPIVLFGTDRESLLDLQGYYIHKFSENQRLLVEGHIDPAFTGLDVSYSIKPDHWEGALTFNSWVSAGSFAPFDIETFEVFLPTGNEPKAQMLGAGVEYVQPFTEDLDVAFGLNYAQYAFADDPFSGTRFGVDKGGFPITAAGQGATERFLAFRANGIYSTLNDRDLPTQGTKIRFGLEQGIEVGNSSTSFTRISTNVSHLFDVPGFNSGDHSLLLNLQLGTILGDPPPIRAFHLGGAASVRGYDPGEMASGKSFVQATAEYRHYLTSFNVLDQDVDARMAVFYDYASTMGTANQLPGIPPQLLGKPEDGYGYGVGLHLASKFGLFRFETAWNDNGRNGFFMTVGERF